MKAQVYSPLLTVLMEMKIIFVCVCILIQTQYPQKVYSKISQFCLFSGSKEAVISCAKRLLHRPRLFLSTCMREVETVHEETGFGRHGAWAYRGGGSGGGGDSDSFCYSPLSDKCSVHTQVVMSMRPIPGATSAIFTRHSVRGSA